MLNETEVEKAVSEFTTGKQCTIKTSAMFFPLYVYFPGPYVEIRAGENHSYASRDMIDRGAFLVMYKNGPLITVHSCSRA